MTLTVEAGVGGVLVSVVVSVGAVGVVLVLEALGVPQPIIKNEKRKNIETARVKVLCFLLNIKSTFLSMKVSLSQQNVRLSSMTEVFM